MDMASDLHSGFIELFVFRLSSFVGDVERGLAH
jgi:hypothetical protein